NLVPVGTSTFYPQHGTPQKPHHAYQVIRSTRTVNGIVEDTSFLHLIQDHAGPAEVVALIVHQGVMGQAAKRMPYGRAASCVRFFWAALPENREAYSQKSCLTEILPAFLKLPDGSRSNAFYEAVARPHFDGRTYDEIDVLTNEDRSLITSRLP